MVESVTITSQSAESVAPSGHEEAMIAKAEGRTVEQPKEESGEKLYAGKFKSAEDLEKAYAEAQKKISELGAGKVGAKTSAEQGSLEIAPKEAGNDGAEAVATEEQAKAVVEGAGLNFQELNSEYQETGSLSEASYASLEKAGIPKEYIDGFIAGQEAIAERNYARMTEVAGGADAYAQMTAWASEAWTEAQIDAYNKALNGGVDGATLAIKALRAEYEANYGRAPKLLSGAPAAASTDVYSSVAELTRDMSNPLYSKDPAFRSKVQEKLGRSSIL